MPLQIIYEDDNIIVIDKQAGIAVHPKDKHDKMPTIVGILYKVYPKIKKVGENPLRPGIVHRLDKETSGLMVVAKNNETFFELKKQFQQQKIEKKYIALVSGVLEKDKGTIKMPLIKIGTKTSSRLKSKTRLPVTGYQIHAPKLKHAVTEYTVLKTYKGYTLVEVRPKTGRQHQIRVHFASINHPLACDKLYGRKSKKCPVGLNRHFLHASYLKFRIKNALMEFESDLPKDLAEALKKIDE